MTYNQISEPLGHGASIDVEIGEHYPDGPGLYLQAMLDALVAAAAVLDESGNILYVNRAWRQSAARNGITHELSGVGQNYLEICRQVSGASAEEAGAIVNGITQILLRREMQFHHELPGPDSKPRSAVLIQATRFDLPNAFRIMVTHTDVSLERWNGRSGKKYLESLAGLLKMTNILPWEADAESGRFTYVGEQATRLLGYPPEQWYEPDFRTSHLHPDDRKRANPARLKQAKVLGDSEFEFRMIAKDGRVVWLRNLLTVIDKNAEPKTVCGFMIDVTEHKRAEEALINLSGRLIDAQEEERKRIARELHDDLNQRMALLSVELEQLGCKIQNPRNLRALAQRLQTRAQEISAEIHRISYRLHPSKLDHLGAAAAIESLCKEFTVEGRLKVDFLQKGVKENIPLDVRLCLFRITQEALRNCLKHSGATKVRVVLEMIEGSVRLSVSDDGCGFDPKAEATTKGLGFTSMRERLRLVGGEMQIYTQISGGTKIEISVPLAHDDAAHQNSTGDRVFESSCGLTF